MKKFFAIILSIVMVFGTLTGCGTASGGEPVGALDPQTASPVILQPGGTTGADFDPLTPSPKVQYEEFAMKLLRETADAQGNVMVSPASVYYAMAMVGMAAEGDTYTQIANLFGDGLSKADIDAFLTNLTARLSGDELQIANSAWLNKDNLDAYGIKINTSYESLLRNSYRADFETLPFDTPALSKINGWVNTNTKGMIPSILNELEPDMLLILINAIAFEAKWKTPYEADDINEYGIFTNAAGQKETAKMMCHTELSYLENDTAVGFKKNYEGERYAFVAMLPKDDTQPLTDYLSTVDGETFSEFVRNESHEKVLTYMPAFSSDYEISLIPALQAMGVTDAFLTQADFSGMLSEPKNDLAIWIDKVIHKTHIDVDEQGTKAAAVTIIITKDTATAIGDVARPKTVRLNRPFVYAIVENETGFPIFIGTVNTLTK